MHRASAWAVSTVFIVFHLLDLAVGNAIVPSCPSVLRKSTGVPLDLPLGYDDFDEIMDTNVCFVDKSLFIKDILDDQKTKVAVITRPRRFGKSTNLSMLRYFLSLEVEGANRKTSRHLFERMKIGLLSPQHMQDQGKYPVVFISLKQMDELRFEGAINQLKLTLSALFEDHNYLLKSPNLSETEKDFFVSILKRQANNEMLTASIEFLTKFLFKHHKIKPWLLIDEYDTPIHAAFAHGYYDDMIAFLRGFLGRALKTNTFLRRSVIVGITRFAKESLFSGVNNLEVYSLIQPEYAQYFGFTEEEVDEILQSTGLQDQLDEVKRWYNGYKAGDITLYNPLSIAKFVGKKGKAGAYWINTSQDLLLSNLVRSAKPEVIENLHKLMTGQSIEDLIREETVLGAAGSDQTSVWNLLFMSGYLKIQNQTQVQGGLMCQLCLPNLEVSSFFRSTAEQWVADTLGSDWFKNFLRNLLRGDVEDFKKQLERFMSETVSTHYTARSPEAFYHGLMMGFTASLSENKEYLLRSNREIGYGRFDYFILCKSTRNPSILFGFKKIHPGKLRSASKVAALLEKEAQKALKQIDERQYTLEAENLHGAKC